MLRKMQVLEVNEICHLQRLSRCCSDSVNIISEVNLSEIANYIVLWLTSVTSVQCRLLEIRL